MLMRNWTLYVCLHSVPLAVYIFIWWENLWVNLTGFIQVWFYSCMSKHFRCQLQETHVYTKITFDAWLISVILKKRVSAWGWILESLVKLLLTHIFHRPCLVVIISSLFVLIWLYLIHVHAGLAPIKIITLCETKTNIHHKLESKSSILIK